MENYFIYLFIYLLSVILFDFILFYFYLTNSNKYNNNSKKKKPSKRKLVARNQNLVLVERRRKKSMLKISILEKRFCTHLGILKKTLSLLLLPTICSFLHKINSNHKGKKKFILAKKKQTQKICDFLVKNLCYK